MASSGGVVGASGATAAAGTPGVTAGAGSVPPMGCAQSTRLQAGIPNYEPPWNAPPHVSMKGEGAVFTSVIDAAAGVQQIWLWYLDEAYLVTEGPGARATGINEIGAPLVGSDALGGFLWSSSLERLPLDEADVDCPPVIDDVGGRVGGCSGGQAAVWSVATGLVLVAPLGAIGKSSLVQAMGEDGAATGVTYDRDGEGNLVHTEPFVVAWGGEPELLPVPAGAQQIWMLGVASGGGSAVGIARLDSGLVGLRWTPGSGFEVIAEGASDLRADEFGERVLGILSDGSGFLWQDGKGLTTFDGPAGLRIGGLISTGLTAYRLLARSRETEITPAREFLWDETYGARLFEPAALAKGVDFTGWSDLRPEGMSGTGHTLVGRAVCGGVPVAFRLALDD